MDYKDYYYLGKSIDCNKGEIVSMVQFIQDVKKRMESLDAHIFESTMNHVKEYIAGVQSEIDELELQRESFIKRVESLMGNKSVKVNEYKAFRYRYVYCKTYSEIEGIMGISNRTLHRYIQKMEEMFESVFPNESCATA